tara:strand:- start:368 stop:616 length:249 start_codon:yes stop_codon:yes gene_type:complete
VTKLGQIFKVCPKKWLKEEGESAQHHIDDYFWLKNYNVLPREGAKLDQDARFVAAVNVIDAEARVLKEHFLKRSDVRRRTKN